MLLLFLKQNFKRNSVFWKIPDNALCLRMIRHVKNLATFAAISLKCVCMRELTVILSGTGRLGSNLCLYGQI